MANLMKRKYYFNVFVISHEKHIKVGLNCKLFLNNSDFSVKTKVVLCFKMNFICMSL